MTTTRTHIESTNGTRAAGGESSMHARAVGASRASWPAGVEGGASRLPGCGAANGVLDAHLPGACRKDRVAHAGPPGGERNAISASELREAEERLDALPLVPARDARAHASARLARSRAGIRILCEDAAWSEEAATLMFVFGRDAILGLAERSAQGVDEGLVRFEARWPVELERGGSRHRALLAEKPLRPFDRDGGSPDPIRVGPKARPLAAVADESCGHGIGEDVDHLLHHGRVALKPNGTVAVGIPEGLPAAQRAVDGSCVERVQIAVELGQSRVRIGHYQVEVIREHAEGVDADVVSGRCDREDVPEDGVRLVRRSKEEPALGAPTSDEIGGAREDLSRGGHDPSPRATAVPTQESEISQMCDGRASVRRTPRPRKLLSVGASETSFGRAFQEESIERVVLRTEDGRALAPGGEVRVAVTVFSSSAYGADALELYHATAADAPAWRHVATLLPSHAGLEVLSTTYRLPPGALQAVRARFRYGGTAAPCGTVLANGSVVTGLYDDHDDLGFAVPFGANAVRDASLKVPCCTDGKFYCDSGVLLDGRAALGPEVKAPNTLRSACADGAAGVYHVDPSIDALRVYSADAVPLSAGQTVVAEVEVFASDAFSDEAIDVYLSDDASAVAPTWTWVATLSPDRPGTQTLSAELTLGTGAVQAIRASHRDAAASAEACSAGPTDDHDDLAFDVAP